MFPEFGSLVVAVTFAVLLSTVLLGVLLLTVATRLKVADAPLARLAQVTIEVVPPDTDDAVGPVLWFRETKVRPAGKTSLHDTLLAVDGPLLVTVMV